MYLGSSIIAVLTGHTTVAVPLVVGSQLRHWLVEKGSPLHWQPGPLR